MASASRTFWSCCAPVSLGGLPVRGRQRRRRGHSRRGGHSRRRGDHSRQRRRRFVGSSQWVCDGGCDGGCGDGTLFLQASGEGGGAGGGVRGRLNW